MTKKEGRKRKDKRERKRKRKRGGKRGVEEEKVKKKPQIRVFNQFNFNMETGAVRFGRVKLAVSNNPPQIWVFGIVPERKNFKKEAGKHQNKKIRKTKRQNKHFVRFVVGSKERFGGNKITPLRLRLKISLEMMRCNLLRETVISIHFVAILRGKVRKGQKG